MTTPPTQVCIRTTQLRRKQHVDNLKEWLAGENNVYCGRAQRVFVHWNRPLSVDEELPAGAYINGKRHVVERVAVSNSIWHNPFKIKYEEPREAELTRVLEEFRAYLSTRLQNEPQLVVALRGLAGKNLGCWCTNPSQCHTRVIQELFEEWGVL